HLFNNYEEKMYQNDFFIGIVEQAQKKEYAHTSGKIKTRETLFSGKKVEGNIDTKFKIGYEFKIQGHSEVFYKDSAHVIQTGDKVIFRATKNKYGIFEVKACKNFTQGWIFGAGLFMSDILKIPFMLVFGWLFLAFIIFIVGFIVELFIPNEYESYVVLVAKIIYIIIAVFITFGVVWDGLYEHKKNKELKAMQFPENFNE
ncbi:hypothetical protein ACWA77_001774, partial [Campylobacter upsaliensis]